MKSCDKYTIVVLRRRTIGSLLPILVLCASVAFGQEQKTVGKLVTEAKHGDKAALQKLITLGNAGNADAQVNLGALYEQGSGVPKDYAQAVNWYRKAAAQGDAEGEIRLGGMYYDGHGVPKDVVQIANWYRKAAEQGNPKGQYSLGVLYSNGDGVPKDHVEAATWYKKGC
jgi:TPR repeat protein